MIFDDAEVFEREKVDSGPDNFIELMRMASGPGAAQAGPLTETSMRLLDEMASQPWPPPDASPAEDTLALLDKSGHRRRAGILSRHEGNVALWATEGYSAPVGPHARSGPMLSPACRARMLLSLERDAPADMLVEIRALARRKEHDGISAWRAYREKQSQQQQQQPGSAATGAAGGAQRVGGSGSAPTSSILKLAPSSAGAPLGSRR